jgi:DNA-binding FrmR family transcriptional regulator
MNISETAQSHTKQLIRRLHRIQGQLVALEQTVVEGSSCEDIVTSAYTIEKALASFIMQALDNYFDCHINTLLEEEPEVAKEEIRRLFQLVNRWTFTIGKDE